MKESTVRDLYNKDKIRFEPLERFAEDVRIEVIAPELLKDMINIYVLKQDYTLYGNDACIKELVRVINDDPSCLK